MQAPKQAKRLQHDRPKLPPCFAGFVHDLMPRLFVKLTKREVLPKGLLHPSDNDTTLWATLIEQHRQDMSAPAPMHQLALFILRRLNDLPQKNHFEGYDFTWMFEALELEDQSAHTIDQLLSLAHFYLNKITLLLPNNLRAKTNLAAFYNANGPMAFREEGEGRPLSPIVMAYHGLHAHAQGIRSQRKNRDPLAAGKVILNFMETCARSLESTFDTKLRIVSCTPALFQKPARARTKPTYEHYDTSIMTCIRRDLRFIKQVRNEKLRRTAQISFLNILLRELRRDPEANHEFFLLELKDTVALYAKDFQHAELWALFVNIMHTFENATGANKPHLSAILKYVFASLRDIFDERPEYNEQLLADAELICLTQLLALPHGIGLVLDNAELRSVIHTHINSPSDTCIDSIITLMPRNPQAWHIALTSLIKARYSTEQAALPRWIGLLPFDPPLDRSASPQLAAFECAAYAALLASNQWVEGKLHLTIEPLFDMLSQTDVRAEYDLMIRRIVKPICGMIAPGIPQPALNTEAGKLNTADKRAWLAYLQKIYLRLHDAYTLVSETPQDPGHLNTLATPLNDEYTVYTHWLLDALQSSPNQDFLWKALAHTFEGTPKDQFLELVSADAWQRLLRLKDTGVELPNTQRCRRIGVLLCTLQMIHLKTLPQQDTKQVAVELVRNSSSSTESDEDSLSSTEADESLTDTRIGGSSPIDGEDSFIDDHWRSGTSDDSTASLSSRWLSPADEARGPFEVELIPAPTLFKSAAWQNYPDWFKPSPTFMPRSQKTPLSNIPAQPAVFACGFGKPVLQHLITTYPGAPKQPVGLMTPNPSTDIRLLIQLITAAYGDDFTMSDHVHLSLFLLSRLANGLSNRLADVIVAQLHVHDIALDSRDQTPLDQCVRFALRTLCELCLWAKVDKEVGYAGSPAKHVYPLAINNYAVMLSAHPSPEFLFDPEPTRERMAMSQAPHLLREFVDDKPSHPMILTNLANLISEARLEPVIYQHEIMATYESQFSRRKHRNSSFAMVATAWATDLYREALRQQPQSQTIRTSFAQHLVCSWANDWLKDGANIAVYAENIRIHLSACLEKAIFHGAPLVHPAFWQTLFEYIYRCRAALIDLRHNQPDDFVTEKVILKTALEETIEILGTFVNWDNPDNPTPCRDSLQALMVCLAYWETEENGHANLCTNLTVHALFKELAETSPKIYNLFYGVFDTFNIHAVTPSDWQNKPQGPQEEAQRIEISRLMTFAFGALSANPTETAAWITVTRLLLGSRRNFKIDHRVRDTLNVCLPQTHRITPRMPNDIVLLSCAIRSLECIPQADFASCPPMIWKTVANVCALGLKQRRAYAQKYFVDMLETRLAALPGFAAFLPDTSEMPTWQRLRVWHQWFWHRSALMINTLTEKAIQASEKTTRCVPARVDTTRIIEEGLTVYREILEKCPSSAEIWLAFAEFARLCPAKIYARVVQSTLAQPEQSTHVAQFKPADIKKNSMIHSYMTALCCDPSLHNTQMLLTVTKALRRWLNKPSVGRNTLGLHTKLLAALEVLDAWQACVKLTLRLLNHADDLSIAQYKISLSFLIEAFLSQRRGLNPLSVLKQYRPLWTGMLSRFAALSVAGRKKPSLLQQFLDCLVCLSELDKHALKEMIACANTRAICRQLCAMVTGKYQHFPDLSRPELYRQVLEVRKAQATMQAPQQASGLQITQLDRAGRLWRLSQLEEDGVEDGEILDGEEPTTNLIQIQRLEVLTEPDLDENMDIPTIGEMRPFPESLGQLYRAG